MKSKCHFVTEREEEIIIYEIIQIPHNNKIIETKDNLIIKMKLMEQRQQNLEN